MGRMGVSACRVLRLREGRMGLVGTSNLGEGGGGRGFHQMGFFRPAVFACVIVSMSGQGGGHVRHQKSRRHAF